MSKSKWGRKKSFSLGRLELPNAEALCSSLNVHIAKALPRLKKSRFKIFNFDRLQNVITVSFPTLPYLFSLKLNGKLLELVGMEKTSKPVDYTILGQSKPQDFYLYTFKNIKGETVTEKRYFVDGLKKKLVSKEQIHSYFLYPPKLASQHSIYLYCSIVEDSLISNSRAPLLRIIPLLPTTRRVTQNFGTSLQFVKLRTSRIREIRIWMADMYGIPLTFNSYTRLTLIVEPPPRPGT